MTDWAHADADLLLARFDAYAADWLRMLRRLNTHGRDIAAMSMTNRVNMLDAQLALIAHARKDD